MKNVEQRVLNELTDRTYRITKDKWLSRAWRQAYRPRFISELMTLEEAKIEHQKIIHIPDSPKKYAGYFIYVSHHKKPNLPIDGAGGVHYLEIKKNEQK